MTTDPLAELLVHLERDGDVPLRWMVAHAPDGDLEPAWRACTDLKAMLRLAACAETRAATRATCACLRIWLPLGSPAEPRPGRAVAVVERWCNGAATFEAMTDALDDIEQANSEIVRLDTGSTLVPETSQLALAAYHLVRATFEERAADAGAHLAAAADNGAAAAAAAAAFGTGDVATVTQAEALASAASGVRAQLPRPTFDQLRAAYRPG